MRIRYKNHKLNKLYVEMQSKGSSSRLSSMASRSTIPTMFVFMFAAFSTIYVAGRFAPNHILVIHFNSGRISKEFRLLIFVFLGAVYRLWQDSQNRVYLIKELDRITGQVVLLLMLKKFFFFVVVCLFVSILWGC